MIEEKQCGFCKKFFFHEDGLLNEDDKSLKVQAWCPNCVDPLAVRGLTYEKTTLLRIISTEMPEEDVINLLPDYPGLEKLYYSNTYRTVTLYEDMEFLDGNFRLGEYTIRFRRECRRIYCTRCGQGSTAEKYVVLKMFVGLRKKLCRNCDRDKYGFNPNIEGLAKLWGTHHEGGRKKEKSSLRELCKQLNVGMSEYRKGNTEPRPALPEGTVVNNLRIVKAWYDDSHNVYKPFYLVECVKCNWGAKVVQKWIETSKCLNCDRK